MRAVWDEGMPPELTRRRQSQRLVSSLHAADGASLMGPRCVWQFPYVGGPVRNASVSPGKSLLATATWRCTIASALMHYHTSDQSTAHLKLKACGCMHIGLSALYAHWTFCIVAALVRSSEACGRHQSAHVCETQLDTVGFQSNKAGRYSSAPVGEGLKQLRNQEGSNSADQHAVEQCFDW